MNNTLNQTIQFIKGPSPWHKDQVCTHVVDGNAIREPDPFRLALLQEMELPLPHRSLAKGFWLAELTNALQKFASCQGAFSSARDLGDDRQIIAFSYEEEEIARNALGCALWFTQVTDHLPCKNARDIPAHLRELGHRVRLGPSTFAILSAALEQGIPVWKLSDCSLLQMGLGHHQQRVWTAETGHTPMLAENIAQDKEWTRKLLEQIGVPVPSGRVVSSREEAWETAQYIGLPVVVKPQFGSQGKGVSTNLLTEEQVMEAFDHANILGKAVVTESFKEGDDYRLLVIGDTLVAASLREPAQVTGDGKSSIRELVKKANQDPRRAESHAGVLSPIPLDSISLSVLASQGLTPESTPETGTKVLIRRNANLSTGGTARDVTDQVHPEVARLAIAAARQVGLDIAGVDIISRDISQPLALMNGAVVEINAGPGLRMHLEPSEGQGRPVGKAIVGMLFPEPAKALIPMVAVLSNHGAGQISDQLLRRARTSFGNVGLINRDGVFLDDRKISPRSTHAGQDILKLLQHPDIQFLVAEITWEEFARDGLGLACYSLIVCADAPEGGVFTPSELLQELRHGVTLRGKILIPQGLASLTPALSSFWAKTILCCAAPWHQCLKYLALGPKGIIQVHDSRLGFFRGETLEMELPLEQGWENESVLGLAGEFLLGQLPKPS